MTPVAVDFTSLSQERLVILVQNTSDGDAFSLLLRPHQAPLLAFLTQLTNNASLAEDIRQETLLKAYLNISKYQAKSSFKTWLFGIGYKEFLQANRKIVRFSRLVSAFEGFVRDSHLPDIGGDLDIQNALNKLSHTERAAILLSEVCGLTHVEVATTMNAPLGTAKTYIKRAKDKLNTH